MASIGVRDRTSEFLKEVELADLENAKRKGKGKSSRTMTSKFKYMRPKLLLRPKSEEPIKSTDDDESDLATFLSMVARTRLLIDDIRSKTRLISAFSLDLINSSFQEDQEAKRTQVNELISSMKTNANIANKNLRKMQALIQKEELKTHTNPSNELRIRQTQYLVLVNDFRDAINGFNGKSADCRSQCLNWIQNRLSITDSSKTAEQVEDLMESGNWSIFTDGLQMETQIAREELNQLEDRCKLILKLESTVTELHEMFTQMANLVQAQGDLIDSIEVSVNNTKDYIANAEDNLNKARKSKKRARKCKVFTGIGATVGAVIVCLIVFI